MANLTDLLSASPTNMVANIAGKLIDTIASFFPNPEKRAEAAQAMAMAQLNGLFKEEEQQYALLLEQIKVNSIEASNPSLFVSGWRPAVGWVCVMGLSYSFFAQPLLAWGSISLGINIPPVLELGNLITILMGMLGLGTLRTFEKVKGVAAL